MNGGGGGGGGGEVGLVGGGEEAMEEDGAQGAGRGQVVLMWGHLPGVSPQRSPMLGPVPVRLPPAAAGDEWRDVCGGGCGFAMAISGDASRFPPSHFFCSVRFLFLPVYSLVRWLVVLPVFCVDLLGVCRLVRFLGCDLTSDEGAFCDASALY
jgi:hypothetical protein